MWVNSQGKEFALIIRVFFSFVSGPNFVSASSARDGWMDDLRLCILFNNISVISEQLEVDNERLCAMEPRLGLVRFCLEQG